VACRSVVFPKTYASAARFTEYRHEQAYVLVKRKPEAGRPPPDAIPWSYTGNRLHPTQKPVALFNPVIEAFTRPGDTILDPFCGSGPSLVAARDLGRHQVGIELDEAHHGTMPGEILHVPHCSEPQRVARVEGTDLGGRLTTGNFSTD